MAAVTEALRRILGAENLREQEPMSRHTSFQVGGPADYFLTPRTPEAVTEVLGFLKAEGLPVHIMGKGSNLLVLDSGVRGAVVQLGPKFGGCRTAEGLLYATAGVSLARLANEAAENGLTGLEFASGIPGALGGALCMNAGAYDGEMKQVLRQATVLTPAGETRTMLCDELDLGYRRSRIADEGLIVLSAVLALEPGQKEDIFEKMRILNQKRREKQPLEYPSAGSTFKRPEGYFAGKLLEDAGLKGAAIGGAQVSEKHAGFIVNRGGATARDILDLIAHCQKTVEAAFGVALQPEVKIWGAPR